MKKIDKQIEEYLSTHQVKYIASGSIVQEWSEPFNLEPEEERDLKEFIKSLLSSYRSELIKEIEKFRKHHYAWFRRYGQAPPIKDFQEMEDWIKNTENIGYDQALDDVITKIKKENV